MAKRCIILMVLSYLFFSLELAVGAIAADASPESPLRTVRVTVAEGSRDEFVEQLRKFADANAFAMRVGEVRPGGKHILVQMWREDIKVIAVNPFEPGAFRISFYKNDAESLKSDSIDAMITNLKDAISRLQGATFSEKE